MTKAFDIVLQNEVDAMDIAKTPYYTLKGRFRYQCLCCGEEVYLAAADSRERSPHFRHRRGNNDTECERYLGQPGAVEHFLNLRRHKQEHIEFYFNKDRMTFEICVFFTEKDLQEYEKEDSKMMVFSQYYGDPFLSIPLNKKNFISDRKNYFVIPEFSINYFVSFNSGVNRFIYPNIMKAAEKINIFKVRMQDEHCKLQMSSFLYTDIVYIGISRNKEELQELVSLKDIVSEEIFSFTTENKIFYGVQFYVNRVESIAYHFFQKHGYQIESSEEFNILWPPVYTRDLHLISTKDTIYVNSSFKLIPHENMNVDVILTKNICENVVKIHIENEIKIHEKNIDMCIQRERRIEQDIFTNAPRIMYYNRYTVSNQYDYFLFDQNGCSRLVPGSKIYLSETDRIVGYKNGHLKEIIYAYPKEKISISELIEDIRKYHPQSEIFNPDDFMEIKTDDIVLSYLEECYRNGRINTVVKRYIKEGIF